MNRTDKPLHMTGSEYRELRRVKRGVHKRRKLHHIMAEAGSQKASIRRMGIARAKLPRWIPGWMREQFRKQVM